MIFKKMGRKPLPEIGDGGVLLNSLQVSKHIADELNTMAEETGLSVSKVRRHILDRFFAEKAADVK